MKKTENMPLWVFLAFSSIETRKTALILTLSSLIWLAYCVPWVTLYGRHEWVATLFLLDDWEWFAWSAPITVWYWLSIKWVDKNGGWSTNDAF